MAADVAAAAMTLLAQSDALIIDLRRNGGGSDPGLIASYLFDNKPRPLSGSYDRPSDTLTPSTTLAKVPGRRFGPVKPVFVLTSKRTFSARRLSPTTCRRWDAR
jgi:C-terminal processing protease CtpA/Prc